MGTSICWLLCVGLKLCWATFLLVLVSKGAADRQVSGCAPVGLQ